MSTKFFSALLVSIFVVFFLVSTGFSQTSPSKNFANVKISNFGQMDEHFYRGAQPKKADYAALKALGINTIVDLQEKPTDYEKSAVEAVGMRYVNIPIVDKGYPTQENIDAFLKLIDDPATGVFYAHCAGGRHRTGDMGALYRFTKYGWNYDQVYKEMENYDFYTSGGHEKAKDFVVDYAAKIAASHTAVASAKAPASVQ